MTQVISIPPEYFNQRLLVIDHCRVDKYNQPVTPDTCINRYVAILAYEGLLYPITSHRDVLEYIVKSDIFFFGFVDETSDDHIFIPGVEYYIGLAQAGLRAVRSKDINRQIQLIQYICQLKPSKYDLSWIFAELSSKGMQLDTSDPGFKYIITAMIHTDFTDPNQTGIVRENKYYPYSPEEKAAYSAGLIDDRNYDPKSNIRSYLYGLIDGHHDESFNKIFPEYIKNETLSIHSIESIPHYVGMNGSIFMIDTVLCSNELGLTPNYLLDSCLYGRGNFSGVEFLLGDFRDRIKDDEIQFVPNSVPMMRLLQKYSVDIDDATALSGAITSGDYDLFFSSMIPELYESIDVAGAPGYMMELYLKKHHHHPLEMKMLFQTLDADKDLYRMEIMLRLGYQPESRPGSYLDDIDLSFFPLLNKWLETT